MLALIRTLGPVVAMVIGLGGGSILSGAAFWAWNTFVENPQIVAVERATAELQCQVRTLEAAKAAEAAERARQDAASEAAIKAYLEAADERQRAQDELQQKMEQEIADYEQQLASNGRACLLDDADLGFLRGK
jgi:biopolymer transport protein ExbB/TolQ